MNILLKPKSLNFCWVLGCVHGQTFDLIESLGYECLDGFEALHHKTQSGKLTAAVWDQLIGQGLWEDLLQAKCLESSKRCTYEGCIRHLLNHWPLTQSIIPTKPSMCLRASAVLPIRKSSSWRTSTASLTLASGSVRVSQALRIELGVISENFARKTCKFGFTERKQNAEEMFLAAGFSHEAWTSEALHSQQKHPDFCYTCFANIYDFEANVFSLSITISPDDQGLAQPHLLL